MGRAPCCDKANVKRGPWSPEEDATLKSYVQAHGTGGNWIALPKKAGFFFSLSSLPIPYTHFSNTFLATLFPIYIYEYLLTLCLAFFSPIEDQIKVFS